MRDPDELFAALARSKFRSRFRLGAKETAYLREKTVDVVLEHGRRFIMSGWPTPSRRTMVGKRRCKDIPSSWPSTPRPLVAGDAWQSGTVFPKVSP